MDEIMDEFSDIEYDITTTVTDSEFSGTENENSEKQETEHAALVFLDLAVAQSVEYCQKNDLPQPYTSIWTDFSRPLLNKSLNHYMPASVEPESPALCLGLGVIGVAVAYLPVFLEIQKRKNQPELKPKPKTEKIIEEEIVQEPETKSETKITMGEYPETLKQNLKYENFGGLE